MLKGIAQACKNEVPEDRYGVAVALSQLSKTVSESEPNLAFISAAETGAVLLHVPKVVVMLRSSEDELTVGGSFGIGDDRSVIPAAKEITHVALNSSAPVLCSEVSSDTSKYAKKFTRAGIASAICVPMRVGEINVGAIVAMSETARTFLPWDVEILHVVASQTALTVWQMNSLSTSTRPEEQSNLVQLAHRKIQELSLLNQVSDAVSSTLNLDKLLDIVLEESMAAVGADGGSLMLVNEETGKMEIAAFRGLARRLADRTSQPVGTSIAGWVAEHGESVLVSNARQDPRFSMPFFRDEISSSASVPLKTKSGIIGVLNVNTLQANKAFDERDLELLGTVANQMAVAIDNARLYDRVNRRTKQLDGLLQIARTVTSTLNLDEVLHRLSDEICKLYQLDVLVILLQDELSGRMRLGYGHGLKSRRKYVYFDLAAPLATRTKATGKKLVLRDISSSKSLRTEVSQSEGLKAAICMPLKNQGKLVGMAVGFAREPRLFPKSQIDIMRPLGELAGVAIGNARVYRQKYRIAKILQQRLVPSNIPQIDGLDIGHKFLPAREVGGDYYDFINLGPNKIGVVVGDVTGSDVEAAEYTTMGKHVLRTYAREYESPAEVLTKTNNMICEDTSADMFISLFYGVIDLDRKKLTYANAGCEPAILCKNSSANASTLIADGMLLGIKCGTVYEEKEIDLGSGDILMLYTDGLTEAGVNDQRFGTQAVMDTISANSQFGAQQIADNMHDDLLEFVHGRIADDVAMVVLKIA